VVKKRFNPSAASLMVIYLLLLLLVTTSCGGGGKGSVAQGLRAPEASFSPGSSPADKTSPAQNAGLDCRVDVSFDDALAELDALETPEGVDAALFAELKGALAKALMDNPPARRGSLVPQGEEPGPAHGVRRFVSTVPTDGGNSVDLVVTDEGGPHLVWSEINLGDYDMNSVVSIADITPLAMFYGNVEGGPEWDAWHEAVDGSGEGSIGIEDITPIAAHFGVSVVGYRVMRHPDGAGGWELLDEIERPYDPSQSGQPKERPEYAFDDPSPLADAYYAVQPTDGDYNYGISSNVASFGSPAGSAPDPPPVESGEPGPDELVLSLGEVAMLDEITSEESFTLRTGSEQEYLLVLTSPNEVEEGSDPEDDFQVAVSYTASGASSVSALPPAANRRWTPPVQPSFIPDRAEQERQIAERYGRLPGTGAKHTAAVGDTREFDIVYINGNMSDVDDTITARCTNAGSLADIWVDLTVDDGRHSWIRTKMARYSFCSLPPSMRYRGLSAGCSWPTTCSLRHRGAIPQTSFTARCLMLPASLTPVRRYLEGEPEDPFVGEEVWLNEALSHFTEDWTGFEPLNNFVSPDNYLTASPWVSLPGGNTWNPSIFRRGAGYLLMRYLTDRFGEGVLPELLQRDATGLPLYGWGNVQAATGEDLTTLLLRNGVAMYAAGLGLNTSSQFSYGDVSIDAETGAQHGVRFRGWNESFTGGEYSITEPLAYVLSSGGPASRTFTARENALLFIRLLPSEESSCRITVTPVGGKPIRAAVARIDSGEVIAEGEAGNLAGGGLVLGELSSAEEVDSYAVTISEPAPYVFRVVALTADIEDFTFSINGSAKPNHALDPVTMSYGPPGVYQLRANLTTSGTYDIDIASPDGAGAYYLLVLPY